ncbi:hypothetical protein D6783_05065 [Candidatus Woesearchaeota archaeon]|nr:MAG: hypothetical protein D6783_05065 [Candidatus Woesearchaeota archaeon]
MARNAAAKHSKKGQATFLLIPVAKLVLVALILITLFIVSYKITRSILGANINKDVKDNFERFAALIKELERNPAPVAQSDPFTLIAKKGYGIIGFNLNRIPQVGSPKEEICGVLDDNAKRKAPSQCINSSCLCLYKASRYGVPASPGNPHTTPPSEEGLVECVNIPNAVFFMRSSQQTTPGSTAPQPQDPLLENNIGTPYFPSTGAVHIHPALNNYTLEHVAYFPWGSCSATPGTIEEKPNAPPLFQRVRIQKYKNGLTYYFITEDRGLVKDELYEALLTTTP